MEVLERCHLNAKVRFTPTTEEPTILDMKIKPGSLSAGENQLVALARAILRRTNIVIMDEATSQIDVQLDEQVGASIVASGPSYDSFVDTTNYTSGARGIHRDHDCPPTEDYH
jgi:ABC-type transport system involved in cytochrome bd biosynthesis fused ATPase/permease subunit